MLLDAVHGDQPSGLIVIVAPLVFPIAISLGIDPIHLGIIMVVNMEIGMITPPVGLNLFVVLKLAGGTNIDGTYVVGAEAAVAYAGGTHALAGAHTGSGDGRPS